MKSNIVLEQNKQFLKIISFFASSFFIVGEKSKWFQYLFETLSNLQLIAIILFAPFETIWADSNSTLSILIQDVVQCLSLVGLSFHNTASTTKTVVFLFISLYLFLFLGITGYIIYKYFLRSILPSPAHSAITYLAQTHHTFLFWIINYFLMSILSDNQLQQTTMFNMKPGDAWLIVLCIIPIILNYIFAAIGASFCFDPFITNNVFAACDSKFQRITFLHKAVICPMIIYLNSTSWFKWFFAVFNFIVAIIKYELVLMETPYYNYFSQRIISLMAGSTFAIAFANLVAIIVYRHAQITSADVFFIQVVAILLFFKLTSSRLQSIVIDNFAVPDERLKTKKEVFRKLFSKSNLVDEASFSLSYASNKVCNQSLVHLVGGFSAFSHTTHCKLENCICRYVMTAPSGSNKQYLHEGMFELHKVNMESKLNFQLEILERASKIFKNDNIFNILTAHILAVELHNFSSALFHVFNINQRQKTFQERIMMFYLNQKIEEEIAKFFQKTEENGQTPVNIKLTIDSEKKVDSLFKLIKDNTQDYIDLWDYFQTYKLSLIEFFNKSIKVEEKAEKIENLWNKMIKEDKHLSSYAHALYSTYLTTIRNLPSKAERTYGRYSKEQHKMSCVGSLAIQVDINESSDIVFSVSVARERLGKVLQVSRNIYEELGWIQGDVIGHNITIIQAPFIKEKHDMILLNHLEAAKKPTISLIDGFAQNKNGFILPVSVSVTIFPYVKQEPIYVGILRKKQAVNDFLIIRGNGIVDCYSEGVGKELCLDPHNRLHISQICFKFEVLQSMLEEMAFRLPTDSEDEEVNITFQAISQQKNGPKREILYQVKSDIIQVLEDLLLCCTLSNPKQLNQGIVCDYEKQQTIQETQLWTITQDEERSLCRIEFARHSETALISPPKTRRELIEKWQKVLILQTLTKKSEDFHNTSEGRLSPLSPESRRNKTSIFVDIAKNLTVARKLLRKPTEQQTLNKVIRFDSPSIGTSTGREIKEVKDRIENAVCILPKQKSLKRLKISVFLFAILCISLVCYHLFDGYTELGVILQKINLIGLCQRRTFSLISANINTASLAMVQQGAISELRHINLGIKSWSATLKNTLSNHVKLLSFYNSQIFNGLHLLSDVAQQAILSEQILMTMDESVRIADAFSMITDITNAANKIIRMNVSDIKLDNKIVKYILDNTLNDPLLTSEKILSILSEDYEANLYEIRNKIFFLLGVTLIVGGGLLILLFIDVKKFLSSRNHFIEILLKIDGEMLGNHLKIVSQFYSDLQRNAFNLRSFLDIKNGLSSLANKYDKRSSKRSRFTSKKGINNRVYFAIILVTCTIFVFISVFLMLTILFNTNIGAFVSKRDRMIRMNNLRIDMILENACILAYIGGRNTTTVRNNKLEEQIIYIFEQGHLLPSFMNTLLDDAKGINNTLVRSILYGDMCDVVVLPNGFPTSVCKRATSIIGARGLINLVVAYVKGQEDLKSYFDNSNHSIEAAYEGYSIHVVNEEISPFNLKAGEILEDLFKEDLKNYVSAYREEVVFIMLAYAVVYVALGIGLSGTVWKSMEEERSSWRKIMKQIPFSIMLTNKSLQAYLIKN